MVHAEILSKRIFPHPCYNCEVINKAKQFKCDTSELVKTLKNLIRKDYDLATIVHSLWKVYFAENIDTIPVQLVGLTRNQISIFIFYFIFYYYFMFYI